MTTQLEEIMQNNETMVERVMKNASGYVVSSNKLGISLHSSYENTTTQGIVKNIAGKLVGAARSAIRDLDASDDLIFLRIKTRNFEYLIAAEKEFTIIVQQ